MDRNFKLTLAYDGGAYHGWQRQAGVPTVQEAVENTARRILRHPLSVIGASRTDAGVHARGQTAHVRSESAIPADGLRRAIAHHLPPDISLVDLVEAPRAFHAIRHARAKLYRYSIHAAEARPVESLAQRYCWHVWTPLDLDAMRAAAALLVGRHDFGAFAGAGAPREDNVRTIERICVWRRLHRVGIDVQGDGFLYNMVRIIVGTLVEIGRGHWPAERMSEILASRRRALAGPTAPPQGLTLRWVRYPPLETIGDGA